MTTKLSSEALREMLKAAPEGPWSYDGFCHGDYIGHVYQVAVGPAVENELASAGTHEVCRLIASAPDLASEVLRLRDLVGRLARHADDGGHFYGCNLQGDEHGDGCTCGLSALVAEARSTDGTVG